jgi:hypothetical protein
MYIYSLSRTRTIAQAVNHCPLTKEYNPWKIYVGFGSNNVKVGPVMHLYSLQGSHCLGDQYVHKGQHFIN